MKYSRDDEHTICEKITERFGFVSEEVRKLFEMNTRLARKFDNNGYQGDVRRLTVL